jgi:hypothetical protein
LARGVPEPAQNEAVERLLQRRLEERTVPLMDWAAMRLRLLQRLENHTTDQAEMVRSQGGVSRKSRFQPFDESIAYPGADQIVFVFEMGIEGYAIKRRSLRDVLN